jgi:hypothetical protein
VFVLSSFFKDNYRHNGNYANNYQYPVQSTHNLLLSLKMFIVCILLIFVREARLFSDYFIAWPLTSILPATAEHIRQ